MAGAERAHARAELIERADRVDDLLELGREPIALCAGVAHEHREQRRIGREGHPVEVGRQRLEVEAGEGVLDRRDLGRSHGLTVTPSTRGAPEQLVLNPPLARRG